VLQPDINWCGGLTTVIEVYRLAQAAGLQVCLHRGCEAFCPARAGRMDEKPLAESPRTWFKCFEGRPQIEQGEIRLSDAPGFGVSVDREKWRSRRCTRRQGARRLQSLAFAAIQETRPYPRHSISNTLRESCENLT